MKAASSWNSISTRTVAVKGENLWLAPISSFHVKDDSLVQSLAEWRDAHQYAYPGHFKVTTDGTKNWLISQVIDNVNRLLFLITDSTGKSIGHAGLLLGDEVSEIEIDNILRGESGFPGAMSEVMRTLEEWAYQELGIDVCKLRVLKSNTHAMSFYEKLGYTFQSEVKLTKSLNLDGSVTLVESNNPDSVPDDCFIVMRKSITDTRPKSEHILTAGPSIGFRERTYCSDAVENGWNQRHSDYLNKFEHDFANYIGSDYAIATSSCTGALHLALLALDIGPGDEVIVPEVTWVATASAVAYVGATPVFCDVDLETWCISPSDLESLITEKTKAVIPVHLYGFPAEMHLIKSICDRNNIKIIEDAAPAIGAHSHGQVVGSFGDFGCFSFQGAKMLVTGEGGMLVTSDRTLYEKARKIQDHGRLPGTFWIDQLGRKYKMANPTAALGLAQLERAELQINRKRQIAQWYQDFLGEVSSVVFQREPANSRAIFWMNSLTLGEETRLGRDDLIAELAQRGIDTRPVFPAISQYPIWGEVIAPRPNAQKIGSTSINLPSGVLLSRNSVERVCDEIRKLLK
jgi:perosamine synthetase